VGSGFCLRVCASIFPWPVSNADKERPLLHCRSEGIVEGILGQVEIAQQANQCGKYAPRFGAINGVHLLAYCFVCVFVRHL
jgi:hypothetical protein